MAFSAQTDVELEFHLKGKFNQIILNRDAGVTKYANDYGRRPKKIDLWPFVGLFYSFEITLSL